MSETGGGCVYGGRPLDGVSVSIDDDGRVVLSGPMVAHGYHRRTDAAFAVAGAFRTDDIGRIDEDGFVFVEDRLKDMIISGGENIYSVEVEP